MADDTSTYLMIVGIGTVLTVIVGIVLILSGRRFLEHVFDDEGVATSATWLLGVLFYLVALGFLALISTWNPIDFDGVPQMVVTKVGVVLLVLGILHGVTLLLLARIRNRSREEQFESSMSGQLQQRAARQSDRTRVIEAGGTAGNTGSS